MDAGSAIRGDDAVVGWLVWVEFGGCGKVGGLERGLGGWSGGIIRQSGIVFAKFRGVVGVGHEAARRGFEKPFKTRPSAYASRISQTQTNILRLTDNFYILHSRLAGIDFWEGRLMKSISSIFLNSQDARY